MFMSQFLANNTLQQSVTYPMFICQKEEQSFYDFVYHFNIAMMITERVSNDLVIRAFITSTSHQFFKYNIVSNPLDSLLTLHEIAHRFVESDKIQ
ncbi:hypothetical protein J1N35_037164 [Gossypium stocksii]|uniref:Uncharacterized protein n=1 Tax=Gossypium stocksii TaxID=47602 RepID=A0A9D3UK19_9ROSI|nr:hypothetical protein J1N35_037164 [Gossypium stocksii]